MSNDLKHGNDVLRSPELSHDLCVTPLLRRELLLERENRKPLSFMRMLSLQRCVLPLQLAYCRCKLINFRLQVIDTLGIAFSEGTLAESGVSSLAKALIDAFDDLRGTILLFTLLAR